jgi:DNA-binding NarL/FixJ family response regulator
LILKVKDIIDDFYSKNRNNVLIPLSQKINALLNTNMNTEEDWKTFLLKFEEKHTGFFKKMKILYPQLTNSDLRLCACLKLNLETKEIASLMNLSVRAVENSRYRLRKKLNILPSQNLNEFFLNMN